MKSRIQGKLRPKVANLYDMEANGPTGQVSYILDAIYKLYIKNHLCIVKELKNNVCLKNIKYFILQNRKTDRQKTKNRCF